MGSVQDLGRRLWSSKANGKGGESSSAFQIRLDLTSDQHLSRLARAFDLPKATLAQEILRAGINDLVVSNPYATAADVMGAEYAEEQGVDPHEIVFHPKTGRPLYREEV